LVFQVGRFARVAATDAAVADYVKPICLPFERDLERRDLAKQKLTVSGWGKTNAANLGGSTSLQYAVVTVWNHTACLKSVPPDVRPIQTTQLCANGASKEDACKGDSGGPFGQRDRGRGGRAALLPDRNRVFRLDSDLRGP
jgi:hypothetical protein